MLHKGNSCHRENQMFKHLRNFKENLKHIILQSKEFSSKFQHLPEVRGICINASFLLQVYLSFRNTFKGFSLSGNIGMKLRISEWFLLGTQQLLYYSYTEVSHCSKMASFSKWKLTVSCFNRTSRNSDLPKCS